MQMHTKMPKNGSKLSKIDRKQAQNGQKAPANGAKRRKMRKHFALNRSSVAGLVEAGFPRAERIAEASDVFLPSWGSAFPGGADAPWPRRSTAGNCRRRAEGEYYDCAQS
jgi:hypothetical protein